MPFPHTIAPKRDIITTRSSVLFHSYKTMVRFRHYSESLSFHSFKRPLSSHARINALHSRRSHYTIMLRHSSRVRTLESLFTPSPLPVPGAPCHDYCISQSGVLSTPTCGNFTTWSNVRTRHKKHLIYMRHKKHIVTQLRPFNIYDWKKCIYISVRFALQSGRFDSTYELN